MLASGNGAAVAAALQLVREYELGQARDLRDLERRMADVDDTVCRLLDEVDAEMARRDGLRVEVAELRRQRQELERLVHETRAEIDAAGYDLLDDDEAGNDALAPSAA